MRMRHIVSSVACLALPHSYILSHERLDDNRGGGGFIEYKMCVLIFSTISV